MGRGSIGINAYLGVDTGVKERQKKYKGGAGKMILHRVGSKFAMLMKGLLGVNRKYPRPQESLPKCKKGIRL